MPSSLTYPGVYVEELPSGVRTIVGVATAVTAFIGAARKGPTDTPVEINSYADFERQFGGLWLGSSMSYAVRDFFLNGGARAVIVRLFHSTAGDAVAAIAKAAAAGPTGKDAKDQAKAVLAALDAGASAAAKAAAQTANAKIAALADDADQPAIDAAVLAARALAAGLPPDARSIDVVDASDPPKATTLRFRAANPGRWAARLRVDVAAAEGPGVAELESSLNVPKGSLFKLVVTDLNPGGITETHLNVTLVKDCMRRVDKVLKSASSLLAWAGADLDQTPTPALPDLKTVRGDAIASAYALLKKALEDHPDPLSSEVKAAKQKVDDAFDAAFKSVDDGAALALGDYLKADGQSQKTGLYALEQLYTRDGIFNLLCLPPYTLEKDVDPGLLAAAGVYCEKRRAMLLVDAPRSWSSVGGALAGFNADPEQVGYRGRNAALFFPRLVMANPLHENQLEAFASCGAVAGVFARTDTQRGVWKAPAGLDASLVGVNSFTLPLTDDENGQLNPLGINCLRTFPVFGRVVWGARTLRGADSLADEYKYTPVRRTALFIEESLYRALKWVVFEPNDEPLWAQIRLNVGAFMQNLFRQGAFQGQTRNEAYFVHCDASTTTQNDINLGIVNVRVGFAPLKPAEFVVISLQQMAGHIET